ncbi:MAG TPA: exodeoxyribonuclease VII small subunit [Chloroflexota bacterium]|nr:exodeoxyribonuclease VII small subunit [Chloroflexota bacterium]
MLSSESNEPPANFEEAFGRLRKSIEELESGPLSLDQAIARYEEGVRLANLCNEFLDRAELRIAEVLRETDREER